MQEIKDFILSIFLNCCDLHLLCCVVITVPSRDGTFEIAAVYILSARSLFLKGGTMNAAVSQNSLFLQRECDCIHGILHSVLWHLSYFSVHNMGLLLVLFQDLAEKSYWQKNGWKYRSCEKYPEWIFVNTFDIIMAETKPWHRQSFQSCERIDSPRPEWLLESNIWYPQY